MHEEDSCAMLSFCSECHASILKSKTPALALANHMFLGDVPPELKNLTMIEEAMIAKCRAKSWVVQLQAKNDSTCLPNSQRGLKGHTIIYPQQPQGLTRILPPSVAKICTPICVIFVGAHKPSNEWLKTRAKPLIICREQVCKALEWLHLHNPLYADIEIGYPTLDTFPENDVLPYHIEHLQPENAENADVLTSQYENLERDCGPEDQQEAEFENIVVTNVDGSASSNQLHAVAMRHVKEKGGGYIEVPHDSKPVNEFFNPALFPMIYPTLYPHGLGGFEDSHWEVCVSLKRHVKHLFNLQDKRFQEHYSFMFTVFNILQRRAILLHTSLKVKAQNFGNCDYDIDFYCSLRCEGQLASHIYVDRTADQEMTFLVFGEVAPFHRGTKLGAQGNHYPGKPGKAVCVVSQTIRKIVTDVSCSLCQSRINRLQKIY